MWIEILGINIYKQDQESHPSRVCGLKYKSSSNYSIHYVTPFTGVWIEILLLSAPPEIFPVTPFTGVWIEIVRIFLLLLLVFVTPFTGVWIEIINCYL